MVPWTSFSFPSNYVEYFFCFVRVRRDLGRSRLAEALELRPATGIGYSIYRAVQNTWMDCSSYFYLYCLQNRLCVVTWGWRFGREEYFNDGDTGSRGLWKAADVLQLFNCIMAGIEAVAVVFTSWFWELVWNAVFSQKLLGSMWWGEGGREGSWQQKLFDSKTPTWTAIKSISSCQHSELDR